MKIRISLNLKIILLSVVIATVAYILVGYMLLTHLRMAMVDRARVVTADFISSQANHQLNREMFAYTGTDKNYGALDEFIRSIITREIIDVKFWDRQERVIYALDRKIIGLSFPDNAELREALAGQITTEYVTKKKREHVGFERQAGEFIELYTPISFPGDKKPAGVIEVYYKLDYLNEQVWHIIASLALSFTTIFVLVPLFFLLSMRLMVLRPINKLKAVADGWGHGDLSASVDIRTGDEFEDLGAVFNQMIKNVQALQAAEAAVIKEMEKTRTLEIIKLELENKVAERTAELAEEKISLEKRVVERTAELKGKVDELEDFHKLTVGREIKMMELEKEIARRIEAENNARESKLVMEKVLQGIADGVLLLSLDYTILWANDAMLSQLKCRLEDIVGKHCYEVTHKRQDKCQLPYDLCPIDDVLKTGQPVSQQHTHFDENGKPFKVEVTAYPIRDESGKITQFVHLAKNPGQYTR